MLKITPINWVRKPSIWLRVKEYFHTNDIGWLRYLRVNPDKKIIPLDQKKNGSCAVFATAGAVMYNTPIRFNNDEVRAMAVEAWALDGAALWKIAEMFGAAYNLSYTSFENIFDPEAQKILEKGYALVCSVRFWAQFYADGVVDGKVDTEYSDKKPFLHAMYLIKENGKYYFVNSWAGYEAQGYYNKYEVNMDMIKSKTFLNIRCYFLA